MQPLDFELGSRQSYSNLGYEILGRTIESVTKQSYTQYLQPKQNDPIWYHMGDLPGTTAFILKRDDVYIALLLNGNSGSRENTDRLLPLLRNTILKVDKWPNNTLSKF